MSAFESIAQGLEEALKYAQGDPALAKIHTVKLPELNVGDIRYQTGLSQADFAKSIGVAKATLLNWEQGRRSPSGPAQILLALIAKKPTLVQDLLK